MEENSTFSGWFWTKIYDITGFTPQLLNALRTGKTQTFSISERVYDKVDFADSDEVTALVNKLQHHLDVLQDYLAETELRAAKKELIMDYLSNTKWERLKKSVKQTLPTCTTMYNAFQKLECRKQKLCKLDKTLTHLHHLSEITLTGNHLQVLENLPPNVQVVNVYANKLHTIGDLSQCQQLRHIGLSYNNLTSLDNLSPITRVAPPRSTPSPSAGDHMRSISPNSVMSGVSDTASNRSYGSGKSGGSHRSSSGYKVGATNSSRGHTAGTIPGTGSASRSTAGTEGARLTARSNNTLGNQRDEMGGGGISGFLPIHQSTSSYLFFVLSLDIGFNRLTDVSYCIGALQGLPNLRILYMLGNPLSLVPKYREFTIWNLPFLLTLDDADVTNERDTMHEITDADFELDSPNFTHFSLDINITRITGLPPDAHAKPIEPEILDPKKKKEKDKSKDKLAAPNKGGNKRKQSTQELPPEDTLIKSESIYVEYTFGDNLIKSPVVAKPPPKPPTPDPLAQPLTAKERKLAEKAAASPPTPIPTPEPNEDAEPVDPHGNYPDISVNHNFNIQLPASVEVRDFLMRPLTVYVFEQQRTITVPALTEHVEDDPYPEEWISIETKKLGKVDVEILDAILQGECSSKTKLDVNEFIHMDHTYNKKKQQEAEQAEAEEAAKLEALTEKPPEMLAVEDPKDKKTKDKNRRKSRSPSVSKPTNKDRRKSHSPAPPDNTETKPATPDYINLADLTVLVHMDVFLNKPPPPPKEEEPEVVEDPIPKKGAKPKPKAGKKK